MRDSMTPINTIPSPLPKRHVGNDACLLNLPQFRLKKGEYHTQLQKALDFQVHVIFNLPALEMLSLDKT